MLAYSYISYFCTSESTIKCNRTIIAMGVTPLMWKALENFTKFYNRAIWTCPFEWDPKKKRMIYNKLSASLTPWAVAVFGFTSLMLLASLSLLLLHVFGIVDLTLIHGLVATFCTLCLIFGGTGEIVCLYGENFAYAVNSAVYFYTSMSK